MLAEVALIEVDRFLLEEGIDFFRYVDDFRLFAPNAPTAHRWLGRLHHRLSPEGLALNPSKTHVEIADHSREHDEEEEDSSAASEPKKAGTIFLAQSAANARVSGRSRVLRRYVPPKPEREEEFREIDIESVLLAVEEEVLAETASLQAILKAIQVQRRTEFLPRLLALLQRNPTFTQYFCDYLIRFRMVIPIAIRESVALGLGELLTDPAFTPGEWFDTRIAETLGHARYRNPVAPARALKSLPANEGSYLRTALVWSLYGQLGRGQANLLKGLLSDRDRWVRRAVMLVVFRALDGEERKAWTRRLGAQYFDDPLTAAVASNLVELDKECEHWVRALWIDRETGVTR